MSLVSSYQNDLKHLGVTVTGYQGDPVPMQIAKLDDALRRAQG